MWLDVDDEASKVLDKARRISKRVCLIFSGLARSRGWERVEVSPLAYFVIALKMPPLNRLPVDGFCRSFDRVGSSQSEPGGWGIRVPGDLIQRDVPLQRRRKRSLRGAFKISLSLF